MTPRFDLIDIAQALQRRRRFILIVAILAAAGGALAYFLTPKRYKASADVFINNPQYADRNSIFAQGQTQFIDKFGDEENVDKALVIGKSELARVLITQRAKLAQAYGIDTTTRAGMARLSKVFRKNFEMKRMEFQNVVVSYTDTDPDRAANVADLAVRVIEEIYHGYYATMQGNIIKALEMKRAEADSAIAVLTDSLAAMRDRYGIYDILSPNRGSIFNGPVRSSNGRAIEELQNLESLKDQWVSDRARILAAVNEQSVGLQAGSMPYVQVVSGASPPTTPTGLGPVLTILACAVAGALFGALWVLLSTYFGNLTAFQRPA